jgi:hypothetical protein
MSFGKDWIYPGSSWDVNKASVIQRPYVDCNDPKGVSTSFLSRDIDSMFITVYHVWIVVVLVTN